MKNKQFIIPISKMIDTTLVKSHIFRLNQISSEKEIKDLSCKICTNILDCFIQYFNIVESHYCQNPHEINDMYFKMLTQTDHNLKEIQNLKSIIKAKEEETFHLNLNKHKYNQYTINTANFNNVISNRINEINISEVN